MTSLAARVLRTIRRHELLSGGPRVLVAVSGGSDSVALLHLLLELQASLRFRVVGAAHVHHGLRAEAADADESFCRALAASLSLPIHVARVDVRRLAGRERRSLEEAARQARYDALGAMAGAAGVDRIAVGHTRDDQAETVLLQLLRGAGTRGAGGMRPRRGAVVRPLLDVGREELRQWLAARGLPFVDDASNADVRLRRNAVRHCILPVLREHFGPSVPVVLARHAELAQEDEAELERHVAELAGSVIRVEDGRVVVDRLALTDAPPAIRRRLAQVALRTAGVAKPRFEHVRALLAGADGRSGPAAQVSGVSIARTGETVVLGRRRSPGPAPSGFSYELGVPGSVWVPEAGATLAARLVESPEPGLAGRLAAAGRDTAVVSADGLSAPLVVRSWRRGDRLSPLGLGGRKKLQDLFVDRKVPRPARRSLPLVAERSGGIVWVPGHAIDEAYRVTSGTRAVVVLTMSESGGRG